MWWVFPQLVPVPVTEKGSEKNVYKIRYIYHIYCTCDQLLKSPCSVTTIRLNEVTDLVSVYPQSNVGRGGLKVREASLSLEIVSIPQTYKINQGWES